MAELINDKNMAEGSAEKAKSVVRSTWDLLANPAAVTDKLTKAAGKINKPKAKANKPVWDISYLHEYLHDGDPVGVLHTNERNQLRTLVEVAVLTIRAQSGWRSADLCGLLDCGLTWLDVPGAATSTHGVQVRLWDTKMHKKAWSPAVFFPRLADKYARLCVYRALRALLDALRGKDVVTMDVISPTTNETTKGRPLLVFAPSKVAASKGTGLHQPLQPSTISAYFKKAFLDNFKTANGDQLGDHFTPHSARHAVASRLATMGVSSNAISRLTLNSAATLDSTYILPVDLEWATPTDCVAMQEFLPVKLLLPYVHYKSTGGNPAAACDCAKILQQVPQQ